MEGFHSSLDAVTQILTEAQICDEGVGDLLSHFRCQSTLTPARNLGVEALQYLPRSGGRGGQGV